MIIGPSGSGKDTLISGAKLLLDNEKRYVFAQREITRPQTNDAEDHIEISESEFKQKQLENVYSLSWYANGLNYGVTRLDEYIRQEKFVVLNGSRGALKDIRQKYKDIIVSVLTFVGKRTLNENDPSALSMRDSPNRAKIKINR